MATERKCDICGALVEGKYDLSTLLKTYKQDGIEEVCDPCLKDINEALDKARSATRGIVVRMVKRHARFARRRARRASTKRSSP